MPNTKTGTTWAPDIRPEAIETFTETYTPEGGTEQTVTYKRVADHPILNGILDIKAFFATHAGAVWYNLAERKTLLTKLQEQDAVIEELNAKIPVAQSDLFTLPFDVDIRFLSAYRIGNTINFYMSFLTNEDLESGAIMLNFKSPYVPKVDQIFSIRSNYTPYPEVVTLWLDGNGVGKVYGDITTNHVFYLGGCFVF